jgi:hypothetical protein
MRSASSLKQQREKRKCGDHTIITRRRSCGCCAAEQFPRADPQKMLPLVSLLALHAYAGLYGPRSISLRSDEGRNYPQTFGLSQQFVCFNLAGSKNASDDEQLPHSKTKRMQKGRPRNNSKSWLSERHGCQGIIIAACAYLLSLSPPPPRLTSSAIRRSFV